MRLVELQYIVDQSLASQFARHHQPYSGADTFPINSLQIHIISSTILFRCRILFAVVVAVLLVNVMGLVLAIVMIMNIVL